MVETEVKVGVEKSLTGRWCPGRDELGRFKTGTTKRGQWNTLQVLGAIRVENDMVEDRPALT